MHRRARCGPRQPRPPVAHPGQAGAHAGQAPRVRDDGEPLRRPLPRLVRQGEPGLRRHPGGLVPRPAPGPGRPDGRHRGLGRGRPQQLPRPRVRGSRPRLGRRPHRAQRRRLSTAGSTPAPATTSSPSAPTRPTTSPCGRSSPAAGRPTTAGTARCSARRSPTATTCYSGSRGGLKNNDLPPELIEHEPGVGRRLGLADDLDPAASRAASRAAYYFSNLPETAFWGATAPPPDPPRRRVLPRRASWARSRRCRSSTRGSPGPTASPTTTTPHADIRLGQAVPLRHRRGVHVARRTTAKGAMVITYDEWGGFWDHVDPPRIADDRGTPDDPGGEDDFAQLGFRIPSTIVSPWTEAPPASTTPSTSTRRSSGSSRENWGLPYLDAARAASTNSIEGAFRGFRSFDAHADFVPYDLPLARPWSSSSSPPSRPRGGRAAAASSPAQPAGPDRGAEERPAPAGRDGLVRQPRGEHRPPVRGRLPPPLHDPGGAGADRALTSRRRVSACGGRCASGGRRLRRWRRSSRAWPARAARRPCTSAPIELR